MRRGFEKFCSHSVRIDLKIFQHVFNFFVIDARTNREFVGGSIFGAYNLNSKLIVGKSDERGKRIYTFLLASLDEPDSFRIAMTSLLQFKSVSHPKDHICFVGSGNEDEDAAMTMVISRFLQQNINHVSYLSGGYKGFAQISCKFLVNSPIISALHAMLKENNSLAKLNNHLTPENCPECSISSIESGAWVRSILRIEYSPCCFFCICSRLSVE